MLPTVREVLATPQLSTADLEVHANASQLDRPVRWLHPAEVEDIAHLLRGDEIVLTTGVFLSDEPQAAKAYAESLSKAGVAGLILELGRRWTTTPQTLIDACQEVGLAFAVAHREVRFAAVVEEVGGQILDAEVEDLRASERMHETFTRLDVEAAGPAEILAAVVRLAGVPVVLESGRNQVIGYDSAGRSAAELLADWTRRSRGVRVSGRTGYNQRSGWLTTMVGSRGDDWGRLVLLTDQVPRRRDYSLVERAAAALTLHQMRSRARDSIERNAHTSLLAELRGRRVTPEVLSRLEAADIPVRGRRFIGIALRHRAGTEERSWSLSDLAALAASTTRTLGLATLVAVETDHVVALISLPPQQSLETVMPRLTRELRKSASLTIARGEMVHDITDADSTLLDARNILAAADTDDERPWITLEDVHLRGLLHLLRDDDRLISFVRRELGPLLSFDAQKGSSLVEVLTVLLDTRGGKTMAAKHLLLSRPVLYERIVRIESILGVDLDEPRARTSLHIACVALQFLGDDVTGSSD